MQKSPEAFRTISEVADALEVPAHVLRFWESRFTQIRPVKRAGGRRYYRPADIALLAAIRKLLHEDGMTIRGVQKRLREEGVRAVAQLGGMPPPEGLAFEPPGDEAQDLEAQGTEAQGAETQGTETRGTETQDALLEDAATGDAPPPEPAASAPPRTGTAPAGAPAGAPAIPFVSRRTERPTADGSTTDRPTGAQEGGTPPGEDSRSPEGGAETAPTGAALPLRPRNPPVPADPDDDDPRCAGPARLRMAARLLPAHRRLLLARLAALRERFAEDDAAAASRTARP